jgi:hypothetical protein
MLKTPKKLSWWRIISICLILGVSIYTATAIFRLLKWKAYIWFPSYVYSEVIKEEVPDYEKHVIFLMVDHYEPGKGERGAMFNEAWLREFRKVADKHFDTYGNRFRYTWFYPYDHHNEEVLIRLCKMAFDGYGEVELHWHLPPTTNETYPAMLEEAIHWFQQYGAFISSEPPYRTHFAYVAGNWSLDNCDGRSGINNQLEILFRYGCYADFTFSTIGTLCQPKKINSIYYVSDDPEASKSYDDGVDVEVGESNNNRLIIFQGPIAFNWKKASLEYGAVETFALPNRERINLWIDTNIHVRGRPEWVFVKVHSHGCQSANLILDRHLDLMLQQLEEICKEHGISLHYMTAREAYNVVKAAEEGKRGNPDMYRDYRIPKPWNMLFHTEVPVVIK